MHEEILSDKQKNLLPLLRKFRMNFGLVGGTAIALQLGHRRSIDYDLFTNDDLNIDGTIIEGCKALFLGEFNEKLFREKLSYYNDIDHTEKITYMKGFDVLDDEIEKNLTKISLQK